MRYFSVTHRPLEWPLPAFMEPISTQPAGPGVLDLSEQYPECGGRSGLSEYETLFALRRQLQASWPDGEPPADEQMIGISHYRRFAVTRPTGTPSDIYTAVGPAEFATLPEDLFVPPPGTLVISTPTRFVVPVLAQYAGAHVLRDLLHFMGLAVDLGVVDDRTMATYLGRNVLLAAPSVGVYPTGWYLQGLADLEAVADAFQATVEVPREGYQRRVLGFCCERLQSLLALQLAERWPQDQVITNRAMIVSDDATYRTGGHQASVA